MTTTITTISLSSTTTTDGRLPLLTLEEIRLKLFMLLRDAADLSAYIRAVEGTRIIVMNRALETAAAMPGCSGTPKPTVLGEAVLTERLERVRDAVMLANKALDMEEPLPIELAKDPTGCVAENGAPLSTGLESSSAS